MISFPNAKINLGLNVVAKRPDGFHDIETVFFPIPFCDILEIIPSSSGTTTFNTSGLPIPGDAAQNICLKAINQFPVSSSQLTAHRSQLTAHRSQLTVHLHKQIPTGSGLGGGSSDAAFTLKMLNEIGEMGLSETQLAGIALQLGSDCAFFVRNRPAFATGRGEVLEEVSLDLNGYYLALIIPAVHVSTAEAYAIITPAKPRHSVKDIVSMPVTEWKDNLVNDFEAPVMQKYPEIRAAKEKLYELGAVYASMSGSGSAVYGIFTSPPHHLTTSPPISVLTL